MAAAANGDDERSTTQRIAEAEQHNKPKRGACEYECREGGGAKSRETRNAPYDKRAEEAAERRLCAQPSPLRAPCLRSS